MPERWERELSKLRDVQVPRSAAQTRIEAGPRSHEDPPRRDRATAGVVAGAVAIAALAFLWRTFPDTTDPVGEGAAELPTLSITFQTEGTIDGNADSYTRRVDTTISYGDALDESFTSTTPSDAIANWVAAEDLTPFLPGPTVGSRIAFEADGEDPRVLIGPPEAWPNFERFTRIDRLPDEPGQYVLVFEADYPEGIARTARVVQVVEPDVLQLVLRETGDEQALSGDVYVDGRGAAGFLSETSFTEGDSGPLEKAPEAPTFSPEAWLDIEPGSPVMLVTSATTATSGTFDSYDTFDPDSDLPNDLLAGAATIEGSGRVLLAVEATWVHPTPGTSEHKTIERALFFFPIEVVDPTAAEEEPPPLVSPSPTAVAKPDLSPSPEPAVGGEEAAAAPALKVRCTENGAEVLTPVVAAQFDGLHVEPVDVPAGWHIGVFSSQPWMNEWSWWSGSDEVDDGFVRQIPPGDASVVCQRDQGPTAESEFDELRAQSVPFLLIDPEDLYTPLAPECADGGELVGVNEHTRIQGVDPADAEAGIRGSLTGVLPTDVVEMAGYHVEWGSRYWWRIVRDGRVVAALIVGEQGGGVISGWTCSSSGIEGDPSYP